MHNIYLYLDKINTGFFFIRVECRRNNKLLLLIKNQGLAKNFTCQSILHSRVGYLTENI